MKHSPDQPQSTSRKVRTCRLSDEEYNYLETRHNGLSAAIRLLTKGGKYEQQAERLAEIEQRLADITNLVRESSDHQMDNILKQIINS